MTEIYHRPDLSIDQWPAHGGPQPGRGVHRGVRDNRWRRSAGPRQTDLLITDLLATLDP
ncbi:MAG: hypothetical protein QOE54_2123 [Streptosporangiaceae bacterium]|jgi:hypothetical protein|nr:hypothetical protein [Streptosporangiaceae bacterium]MDX6429757.1 hypothetical protein [Streptosporangiaceae bacterium]